MLNIVYRHFFPYRIYRKDSRTRKIATGGIWASKYGKNPPAGAELLPDVFSNLTLPVPDQINVWLPGLCCGFGPVWLWACGCGVNPRCESLMCQSAPGKITAPPTLISESGGKNSAAIFPVYIQYLRNTYLTNFISIAIELHNMAVIGPCTQHMKLKCSVYIFLQLGASERRSFWLEHFQFRARGLYMYTQVMNHSKLHSFKISDLNHLIKTILNNKVLELFYPSTTYPLWQLKRWPIRMEYQ